MFILRLLIALISLFTLLGCTAGAAAHSPPENSEFIRVEDGRFMLGDSVFRFAGTNAYYLPNYQKLNPQVVQNAFNAFETAGITVIRMWAFYDGFDCGYSRMDRNESVIQTAPGVFNEQALVHLDEVIAEGARRGMRFILPLLNYWDELGGICQYNTWAGAEKPSANMRFFLENEDTQRWFRAYIEMLLNRVNTASGIRYKNDPAIMSWQIINEGRNPGQPPEVLRDWYAEMAAFIKNIAPNQLLGTGEEGFEEGIPEEYTVSAYSNTYVLRSQEGTSYMQNTAIAGIDYGSAHWYPQEYGFGNRVDDVMLKAQRAWLNDHQRIAHNLGKPFILAEYGFEGWGENRVFKMYKELWRQAEEIELDGSLLWQLTADYVKCYEFGGNICWPGGREDNELFLLFKSHVSRVN